MLEMIVYCAGLATGIVIAAMRLRGPDERVLSALLRVIPTLKRRL
jgi:xanthosine utilization system XapX-like protein